MFLKYTACILMIFHIAGTTFGMEIEHTSILGELTKLDGNFTSVIHIKNTCIKGGPNGISIDQNMAQHPVFCTDDEVDMFEFSKDTIFAATTKGILYSNNFGREFQHIPLPELYIPNLASCVSALNCGKILVGTTGGIAVLEDVNSACQILGADRELNCKTTEYESDIQVTKFSISDRGTIYAAAFKGGLLISTDNGKSWINKSPSSLNVTGVFSVATHGTNIVYLGTDKGILVSYNAGETFEKTNFSFTGDSKFVFDVAVWNDGTLYAATKAGLFVSKNQGTHFAQATDKEATKITLCEDVKRIYLFTPKGCYSGTIS